MKKQKSILGTSTKGLYPCRIVTFTLTLLILISSSCLSVGAVDVSEFTEYENEITNIMDEKRPYYLSDPEFYMEAADKGLSFEELLRENAISTFQNRTSIELQSGISLFDMGNNGNNVSTSIPLIMQTTTYNCGPTAALQVLYGMGCQSLVSGQTDSAKIQQLMQDCDTDTSGTLVYKLTNALNTYASRTYEYVLGTGITESQFQGKVETSLYYNTAPIIHARTEYLSYYDGHSSGHYIAICEVDIANSQIRLKDCNYNTAYYGEHVESVSAVYQSISAESYRYLICMQY